MSCSRKEGQALGRALLDYQRATVARSQKRSAVAEGHYRASLDTLRSVLGAGHPVNLFVMFDLAGLLRKEGRMAEAEVLVRDALDIGDRLFPQGHPRMIEVLRAAADALETKGSYDEAVSFLEKKMAIEVRAQNRPATSRARDMLSLANIWLNQGKLPEAMATLDDIRPDLPTTTSDERAADLRCRHRWLEGVVEGERGNLAEQERIGRECLQMTGIGPEMVDVVEIGLAAVVLAQHRTRRKPSSCCTSRRGAGRPRCRRRVPAGSSATWHGHNG